MNRSLCIKTVWETSVQFVKILLKYGFQRHIQGGSCFCQIPCYVAKFLYQMFLVQFVSLHQPFFYNINCFPGFPA